MGLSHGKPFSLNLPTYYLAHNGSISRILKQWECIYYNVNNIARHAFAKLGCFKALLKVGQSMNTLFYFVEQFDNVDAQFEIDNNLL